MSAHRRSAYFSLALVSLIWGFATYVVKTTLAGIAPLPFLTYRFALAGLFGLTLLALDKKGTKKLLANFGLATLQGVLITTVALGILFFGLDRSSIIDSALISTIGPLITATFGVVFLHERVTRQERFGITLAVVGTLLTVTSPIITEGMPVKFTGNLLLLGSIVIGALCAVLTKKLVRKGVSPFTLTNYSYIAGLASILPFTLRSMSTGELVASVTNLTLNYHLGVWYMAFISGTLAYALWARAQKSIEMSEVGVFSYLDALFALTFGLWLAGDRFTPVLGVGAVLIVVGVVIAEYKRRTNKHSLR